MNAISIIPEQFIFAQDNELRTTSIKVAEAFGKLHKNVIQKIETLECSKEFHELNFKPMQIDVEIGNGAVRKSPAYEMTKDGFIFLVMGFTGKTAASIKEAYINAFNLMAAKLFGTQHPQPSPEPKTKKAIPGGLTLEHQDDIKALVKKNVEHLPSEKQAGHVIKQWSAIKTKFGCSYKEIPDAEYLNVVALLSRLPIEGELLQRQTQELPYADGSIEARKHIDHLRHAMLAGMDEIILTEAMEELNKIERCIVSAWTHMDESLARLSTCVSMLKRWRGVQ